MSENPSRVDEHDAILATIQHYLDGARSGRSADMKPAFHEGATIFGYVGPDLFAGPIQGLFDWLEESGAAPDVVARVGSVDVHGTVATLRLELDNWQGHRFTDLFTLLKVDGQWKVMNKVFHLHGE